VGRQGVARLPELDRWYREELPALVAGRAPMHLEHAELVRLTEWKMARGVWRAPNLALVRGNDPAAVVEASTAALSKVPHPTAPIAELSKLKGVGPATASAAAAAVAPEVYPFFDEIVAARFPAPRPRRVDPRVTTPATPTLSAPPRASWAAGWTPSDLERALWSHAGGKAG
jgi:hypothetical protein